MKALFFLSIIAISLISIASKVDSNINPLHQEEPYTVADDTTKKIKKSKKVKKKKGKLKDKLAKTKKNIKKAATGEVANDKDAKSGLTIKEEGVEEEEEKKK